MRRIQRYELLDHPCEMSERDDGEWVKFDEIPSWDMLMDILDAVYPASVFTGVSGDPGPRIVVKLREIDAIRNESSGGSKP